MQVRRKKIKFTIDLDAFEINKNVKIRGKGLKFVKG